MNEFIPFFVYGTLIPGQPNDHYWQDAIISARPAVFPNGRLYAFPTFPMLIEAGGKRGMPVQGLLIEVDPNHYQALLTLLDQLENFDPNNLENSPYMRVRRHVQLADEEWVTAWVYLGQEHFAPGEETLITSGDWVQFTQSERSQDEMVQWWQSHGASLLFRDSKGIEMGDRDRGER